MKKIYFFNALIAVAIIAIAQNAAADRGHLRLLAVTEIENGTYQGGTADLYLEIKEGSGRVFLETFPLTKTDTQMSTRFAKAIACDFVDRDCSNVDFFYTITANSPIIAGPSAGSSIAALTAAMLEGREVDESAAATGTINSGGITGPVGGLKEKIEAASVSGIKKVMIPSGEPLKENNKTINLTELSEKLGIIIIETSTIDDVVYEFTGYRKKTESKDIDVNKEYSSKMMGLASELCERSGNLTVNLDMEIEKIKNNFSVNPEGINFTAEREEVLNLTKKGDESFEKEEYYSSASYCFGANAQLTYLLMSLKNISEAEHISSANGIIKKSNELNKKIDEMEKKTLTDLETYTMVKERVDEAREIAKKSIELLNGTGPAANFTKTSSKITSGSLAYAEERYNSAVAWSKFFGNNGKQLNLDKNVIRKSCQDKISEVEERVEYVELYIPNTQNNVMKEINDAYNDLSSGNYELCLFKASKAKAEVDAVISVFGVDLEHFRGVLDSKLSVVKENLAKQAEKGVFSIVGYSYYEYAKSLRDANTISALIYSEYALELGNLDIYFNVRGSKKLVDSSVLGEERKLDNKNTLIVFAIGIGTGFILALIIVPRLNKRK